MVEHPHPCACHRNAGPKGRHQRPARKRGRPRLNVTVAQAATPAIQAGLGAGTGAVQLVLAGASLTYAYLLVPAARLGDRYSSRPLFVASTVVFTVGSVAAACTLDATSLIIARLTFREHSKAHYQCVVRMNRLVCAHAYEY